MPDIQMILDTPQAMQGAGSAMSPGPDGGASEIFGKALSQAKTTINEKATQPRNGQGGNKAPESVHERAVAAKGAQRGKAGPLGSDVPNLPTRGSVEKQADGAEVSSAKRDKLNKWTDTGKPVGAAGRKDWGQAAKESALAAPQAEIGSPASGPNGHGLALVVTSEHNKHLNGLARINASQWAADGAGQSIDGGQDGQLAADGTEGWLLKAWWDAMIERPDEQDEENPDGSQPEKGFGAAQGPADEDEATAPDNADNANAVAKAMEAIKGAARLTIKNASAEDMWLETTKDAAKEILGSPSAERPKAGVGDEVSAQSANNAVDADTEKRSIDETALANAKRGQDVQGELAASAKKPSMGANAVAQAEAQTKVQDAKNHSKAQAGSQLGAAEAGNKSMAEAERALGLRQEMAAEGSAEKAENIARAHQRNGLGNGQAPIEIESALPMQNKGVRAKEQAGHAKEAKEAKEAKAAKIIEAQKAESEDASTIKAAPGKQSKFRAAMNESNESERQASNAKAEGPHIGQRHLQPKGARGAATAKEAAEEAVRQSAGVGKGAKDVGAPMTRGRRQAQAVSGGQDSLSAQAREAAKAAPPPMRMDAAPQGRAEDSAKGGKNVQNSQGSQSGHNNQGGQINQSSIGDQSNENHQSNEGHQGQNSGAAHKGVGEMAGAKHDTALARQADGSASSGGHSAVAADAKTAISSGPAQANGQAQAAPGAPILPGSAPSGQTMASTAPDSTKPPLPPQAPMAQLDGSVKWMLRNEQQAAEIQLYPEHLGKVTIRLRVEGNEVHARVWASDASTLPVLREQRAYLESSLKEQGLQLSSFDLQHGKGGQQTNSEGQNRPQGQHFHFGAQVIESWNGAEFRQELPNQVAAQAQNGDRVELYA
jgi:flagellar hook-length control protein FliK